MGVHLVHAALSTDYVRKLIIIKARQVVRKPGFSRSDQPDIEQDLVTHVLKKAHLFDPARATVQTFMARVVDSAIAMILRDRHRQKRAAGFHTKSLASMVLDHERKLRVLADMVSETDLRRRYGGDAPANEDIAVLVMDFSQVLADLSPELRDVAARLPGGTEASIARDLGKSRRQVRKAIAAIKEHFEAAGLTEI